MTDIAPHTMQVGGGRMLRQRVEPVPAIDSCWPQLLGPCYLISLANKPERRAFCLQQFSAEQGTCRVFDAIVPPDSGRFPTRGAFGCYQSHMRVLEMGLENARRRGVDRVTVFEDDVLLPRGFTQIVSSVSPRLAELDWTFFYWGMQNNPPTNPLQGHEPVVSVDPQHPLIGKQAYTVHASIIPDLLDHLHECGQRAAPGYSDGMIHEFRMKRGLPAHTHRFALARQGSFASNITPNSFHWFRQPLRVIKRHVQLLTR